MFAVFQITLAPNDKPGRRVPPRQYNRRWAKARATYLRRNPYCAFCLERGVQSVARIVDHIEPHRGDSSKFWDSSNWQGLCKTCHDGAKQSEEVTGVVRGVDAEGNPLDPNHAWSICDV